MRLTYDMPIGDPMSGIAYGDKHKSKAFGAVLGVAASAATMGAAAPMLTGGLASQLAGGAMMAGGLLNGVGTVTGNKKLKKIGGVLSLAGGAGALGIKGAEAFGVGNNVLSVKGSDALANFSKNAMGSVNKVFGSNIYTGAGVDQVGGVNVLDKSPAAGSIPLGKQPRAIGVDINPDGSVAQGGTLDLANPPAPKNSLAGIGTSKTNPAAADLSYGGATNAPTGGGILGNSLKFANDNSDLMKVGLQAVSAFAGPGLPDQQAYVDARTAGQTTANSLAAYRLENLQKQAPVISENDPAFATKVAAAKANGIEPIIMPVFGKGILNNPNGQGAQNITSAVPVTQPTYQPQAIV